MNIQVGISSCLLGEKVRYDGGHKQDHYLKETLGQYVSWIPVCPEVECGLSIPREAMRLVRTPEGIRLKTQKTELDYTQQMDKWIGKKIAVLKKMSLCGFVFKTKSPSSGMRGIKIYDGNKVSHNGVGLFAKALMEQFPDLPVEDNGRLHDPYLRENFITRVFVFHRWQNYIHEDGSAKGLVLFHSQHKFLLMAHSKVVLAQLGKITAQSGRQLNAGFLKNYLRLLMQGLKMSATVKKNTDVLYHILGYFKKIISADEKNEAIDVIENYYRGLVPLIVPITLLQHHLRKHPNDYLASQQYLHPHPLEFILRNNV